MKTFRDLGLFAAGLAALSVVALAGSGMAAAQNAEKSLLNVIQERGVLRVGTTGDYYPMTFRDPASGEFSGHQIDAAKELAKDLGVELEFVPTEWKTIITGIQAGKYDIAMSGTSMSLSRAKVVGLVDSWGMNGFVPVILRKNEGKYKSWDDLNSPDQTVGVTLGTTMEDYIRAELPEAKMKRVESPGTGWQEVLAGRADYTVTTMIEASGLQQRYENLMLIFPNQPRAALPMTFLVPVNDHMWREYMNNWVYLKKTSGFFNRLHETWNVVLVE